MTVATPTLDATTLRAWIVNYISSVLELSPEAVSESVSFEAIGLDSLEVIVMAGVMEEDFGVEIQPSLFFDDHSIDGLVAAFRRAGLVEA